MLSNARSRDASNGSVEVAEIRAIGLFVPEYHRVAGPPCRSRQGQRGLG